MNTGGASPSPTLDWERPVAGCAVVDIVNEGQKSALYRSQKLEGSFYIQLFVTLSPCQRVALPFRRFKSRLHNIFERLACGLTRPHVSDEAYTCALAKRHAPRRSP